MEGTRESQLRLPNIHADMLLRRKAFTQHNYLEDDNKLDNRNTHSAGNKHTSNMHTYNTYMHYNYNIHHSNNGADGQGRTNDKKTITSIPVACRRSFQSAFNVAASVELLIVAGSEPTKDV